MREQTRYRCIIMPMIAGPNDSWRKDEEQNCQGRATISVLSFYTCFFTGIFWWLMFGCWPLQHWFLYFMLVHTSKANSLMRDCEIHIWMNSQHIYIYIYIFGRSILLNPQCWMANHDLFMVKLGVYQVLDLPVWICLHSWFTWTAISCWKKPRHI